jgi:hypothetical protein
MPSPILLQRLAGRQLDWLVSAPTKNLDAALIGHASLKEIVRYTQAADRKQLARAAMEKVKARTSSG